MSSVQTRAKKLRDNEAKVQKSVTACDNALAGQGTTSVGVVQRQGGQENLVGVENTCTGETSSMHSARSSERLRRLEILYNSEKEIAEVEMNKAQLEMSKAQLEMSKAQLENQLKEAEKKVGLIRIKEEIQLLRLEEKSRSGSRAGSCSSKRGSSRKGHGANASDISHVTLPSKVRVQEWIKSSPLHVDAPPRDDEHKPLSQLLRADHPPHVKGNSSFKQGLRLGQPCQDASGVMNQPTFSHYVARQSTGKDLPTFNGDPLKWPAFHSQFQRSTDACGFSQEENMLRLQKALKGKAFEVVAGLLPFPNCLDKVIDTLHMRFGRTEYIVKRLIDDVRALQCVKGENIEAILDMATAVQNLVIMLQQSNAHAHLTNPQLMDDLIKKLPVPMRIQWAELVIDMPSNNQLEIFSSWLQKKARALTLLTTPNICEEGEKDKRSSNASRSASKCVLMTDAVATGSNIQHVPASQTVKITVDKTKGLCKYCDSPKHKTPDCKQFLALQVTNRREWVAREKRCFVCLGRLHQAAQCKKKKQRCNIEGCGAKHHPLLHKPIDVTQEPCRSTSEAKSVQTCSVAIEGGQVLLSVVPVVVTGPKGHKATYALLDSGSSITLCDSALAEELGCEGTPSSLEVQWLNGKTTGNTPSLSVNLHIQGCSPGADLFCLNNIRTFPNLTLPTYGLCKKEMLRRWPQFAGLELAGEAGGRPEILIGQDNWKLLVHHEVIEGPWDGPVATRTRLGWSLQGNISTSLPTAKQRVLFIQPSEDWDCLDRLIRSSFSLEDFGVKISENLESKDDKRAKVLMDQVTRKVSSTRWETGLLWKDETVTLPDNKHAAFKRLRVVERKMYEDQEFAQQYVKKINDYISKGYARLLTPEEQKTMTTGKRVWYLPHLAVTNPNKPGKIRVVFDAKAKVNGVGLNTCLLKGPDIFNPIIGILWKFRQGKIAFSADISEMYLQILIRREDLSSQLFLWRGMDRSKPPSTYVMQVMLFGAVCSPYSAQDVRNRNAMPFQDTYPQAVDAIRHKHYMDDYLDSVDTAEEAIMRTKQVTDIHKEGSFLMHGWLSNSREVMEYVGATDSVKPLGEQCCPLDLPEGRVLGLYWVPASDVFEFRLRFNRCDSEVMKMNKYPTKRDVTKAIMSVYDPLGFLAYITVRPKILMQNIWRSGVGWDDEIQAKDFAEWRKWLKDLEKIEEVKIPRCYDGCVLRAEEIQLHTFCDASADAFAAVVYFRSTYGGEVFTTMVTAKTRVAPLKPTTIPRLELQAALMGSRLAKAVVEGHSVSVTSLHFWSDSRTVLCWLRSDPRRFKPFVAHRVTEIEELTTNGTWRWVPSAQNPADLATKSYAEAEHRERLWRYGPNYLRENEDAWPQEASSQANDLIGQEEVKKSVLVFLACPLSNVLPDVNRFSSWLRLIRATAKVLLAVDRFKRVSNSVNVTASDMKRAEVLWWKHVQRESFSCEREALEAGIAIGKGSRLLTLSPYLDEEGVIRMKGRIQKTEGVEWDVKNPVILDPEHQYTRLLIMRYHVNAGHAGREMVLNEIRQKFWILRMRQAVRSAWSSCQHCKNKRAEPLVPEMADLPAARLAHHQKPFSHVGVDYFGPYEVAVGRRREKRYGVLFTCLCVRAVHLEVAHSLSTDSAIMAIRRFIGRRGAPLEMWSDNGTNLRGSERELREALLALDQIQLSQEASIRGFEWKFITPAAPHMGGSWERLVRSVKVALSSTLNERVVRDEVLLTLLVEAEHMVNSRPLTHVPVDPGESEAITPNHFLLGSSSGATAPGEFNDDDLWLRKQWRIAQRLADMFWSRWLKEYLPTLAKRTKWFQPQPPLAVGDVVVVADCRFRRNSWPKGVIVEVYPGGDGAVRSAMVKMNTGTLKRPVANLCRLDLRHTDS